MPTLSDAGKVVSGGTVDLVGRNIMVLGFTESILMGRRSVISTLMTNGMRHCMASFPAGRVMNMGNTVMVPRLKTSARRSRSGYTRVTITRVHSFLRGKGVARSIGCPSYGIKMGTSKSEVAVLRHGIPGVVNRFAALLTRRGRGVTLVAGGDGGRCTCAMVSISKDISSRITDGLKSVTSMLNIHIVGWGMDRIWFNWTSFRDWFVAGEAK